MQILILTNSLDSTASELVRIFNSEYDCEVFRWNIDLARSYEVTFQASQVRFQDPVGRDFRIGSDPFLLIWRKPFLDLLDNFGSSGSKSFVRAQFDAVIQGVVGIAKRSGRQFLVQPYSDRTVPKILQLSVAEKYFAVPPYEFSIQKTTFSKEIAVTKSLQDALVDENKLLFTTLVEPSSLERPFPWFIQEAVIEGDDITAVYINGKVSWFRNQFKRSDNNIDWRTEINTEAQSSWEKFDHANLPTWNEDLQSYMTELSLNYGRLDFILDRQEMLWFLEVNPNGEFGWLDDEQLSLHKAFAKAAVEIFIK